MTNQDINTILATFPNIFTTPEHPYFANKDSMLKTFSKLKIFLDSLLIEKSKELIKINVVVNAKMQQRFQLMNFDHQENLINVVADKDLLDIAKEFKKLYCFFLQQISATGLSLSLINGGSHQHSEEDINDRFILFFKTFYRFIEKKESGKQQEIIMENIVKDESLLDIDTLLIKLNTHKSLLDYQLVDKLTELTKHTDTVNLTIGDISALSINGRFKNIIQIKAENELQSMQHQDLLLDKFFIPFLLSIELMIEYLIGARLPNHSLNFLNFEFRIFEKRMKRYQE